MFLVIWEFEVKPECAERFVSIYGYDGDWAQLFRKDENYQRSTLVQDPSRSHVYLTLDFWNSREAYESFKACHKEAYLSLDSICDDLTIAERHIGSFEPVH
ncbi:MAG: antibiotic biosynthesis monooxygenase [Cyanobacteria bacterium]|nr:antibiotic biosynthesis monooxygenase [Cyanobacteriota bacterium]